MSNPRSTAAIGGHPIHPLLVPFPIAFFIAAFLCDLAYWRTGGAFWSEAALWLIGSGLVMGLLAGMVGAVDAMGDSRVRALGKLQWHAAGNAIVLVIELYSFWLRYNYGAGEVFPQGLYLSTAAVALLGVTGWLGGELVYRHRVAVQSESEQTVERAVEGRPADERPRSVP
ncbi:MAG: hypothetical protein CTY15_13510 [Methylocystis sp.]|nr:MAG: hypothetical protein CTY15_13510 [Methylocystis sp.]